MASRRFFASMTAITALSLALIAPPACQAGPAPPLSGVGVYAVASTGHPALDVVPMGYISTPADHSGPVLHVYVLEAGYASPYSRLAQFNGVTMKLIQSYPQYYPYPYIAGYVQEFEYVGPWISGTFTYQATSLVVPIRTLSTRLYIR